jgi:D-amino-acid oxidase
MAGSSGEIAVIGSGVVGLTAALELRARGAKVVVYADREAASAASLIAPALFTPYPGPDEARFKRWTAHAFKALSGIAAEHGAASGVRMGELREYFYKRPAARPWMDAALGTRPIRPIPAPFVEASASVRPHIDMLRYLPWLELRARSQGVRFERRLIGSFDEVFGLGHRVVVNAAGVGAAGLAEDQLVKPMHGQVLHVPNDIGLTYSLHDDAGGPGGQVAYIFVFEDRLVLGGTFDAGRDDHRTERVALDAIVQRCRGLLRMDGHPRWSELGRREIRALAGVRPTRGPLGEFEHTRVEREDLGQGRVVVHCYGHGRSGATLSWASAADVAELAFQDRL